MFINQMTKQEFLACYDEASRRVNSNIEDLKDSFSQMEAYRRVLDAGREAFSKMDKLNDELEEKQQEVDDLQEQLEAKQAEMDDMQRTMQAEIDDLRRQLLEAQNEHLESERHHLEAEVHAKPLEIHNHFGAGSNSQVFNDKVTGRFTKQVKKDKKDKKDKKNRRWKKIVRKML